MSWWESVRPLEKIGMAWTPTMTWRAGWGGILRILLTRRHLDLGMNHGDGARTRSAGPEWPDPIESGAFSVGSAPPPARGRMRWSKCLCVGWPGGDAHLVRGIGRDGERRHPPAMPSASCLPASARCRKNPCPCRLAPRTARRAWRRWRPSASAHPPCRPPAG